MSEPRRASPTPEERKSLHAVALRFQEPRPAAAVQQVATTLFPLVALLIALYAGLAARCWPVLVLALPAAALTVRTFIIQHDCGHGSFLRSRPTNDALGVICSFLTLTPYAYWRRQHARHHAAWNDLDRRADRGLDIYSSCLTVAEYRTLGRWRQRLYRFAKHPAISLLVLPPLIFLLLYRFPFDAPRNWRVERRGVHLTNLALLAFYGTLGFLLGFAPVAIALLAVMLPASILGVWLFSLQHHFRDSFWARHAQWDPIAAALNGSSFLRLPRVLQWITGNIGFHHVHHLAPRIPNYRLEDCHNAHPAFAAVTTLSMAEGMAASRHALWDESRGRMVTFAEANQAS